MAPNRICSYTSLATGLKIPKSHCGMTLTDELDVTMEQSAVSGKLADLLSPVDPEVFFNRYWNKKALYIKGHPTKLAGLFDRDAFMRAAHSCADLKVGYTDENGWPAHFNVRPDQIPEMLAKGKTVCASVVDPGEPRLTAFLNEYRKSFRVAGRFFFNSYLSPHGAGFGLHLDHHPVSILQLDGQKRWWYSSEPGLKQVLSNVSFPAGRDALKLPWVTVERPAEDSLCEVVLNAGDVLYLPKGCWHRAQAIGHSLGLTLAMESVSLLDLIQAALLPKFNTVAFRDALPGYPLADQTQEMPSELEELFASGLQEVRRLIEDFSPSELYASWMQVGNQTHNAKLRVTHHSSAAGQKRAAPTQTS